MNTAPDTFYAALPVFSDFTQVSDEARFAPLPDGWMVGVADVVQSTKAIKENRYKAVNMAGAAVIVAITNALKGRDFPFVFGGDGAAFAVAGADAGPARQALAETAAWVKDDLDLSLRIGMVAVADIRARGFDVRVARYAPSENISIAMFSGGGLAYADAAMKRGEIAVAPAAPGAHPDLTGRDRAPRRRISAPSSRRSPASSRRRRMPRGPSPARASSSNGRPPASILKRGPRAAPASRSPRARPRSWRSPCSPSSSCALASASAASSRANTSAS
jgi:hypothetical protein